MTPHTPAALPHADTPHDALPMPMRHILWVAYFTSIALAFMAGMSTSCEYEPPPQLEVARVCTDDATVWSLDRDGHITLPQNELALCANAKMRDCMRE